MARRSASRAASPPPVNVLVVGAGMFVCGTGTDGYGTVLPALFEGYRQGLVQEISIAATNPHNRAAVAAKAAGLNSLMGLDVPVAYAPQGDQRDEAAYLPLADSGRYQCAIVSVPDHLHFAITRDLMQRGLHCMVVKPLVPTLREWAELRAVQQQHHVYGVVEFHKRFDESNLYARRAIRSGALGDLLYVSVHYSQKQSIPLETFRAWAARSNIFQYLGVHYIDQIYYCSGALPRRALATGQRRLLAARGVDTYDAIQALIEWEQPQTGHRFTASLLTNWIDPLATSAMSDQHITYVGTRGRLECEQKERGLRLVSDDSGIQDINPYFSSFQYNIEDTACDFRGYGYASLIQFLRDCAALQQGQVTPDDLHGLRATFADCRASTAVIEAVNTSLAHDGAWITVDNEHSEGSKYQ